MRPVHVEDLIKLKRDNLREGFRKQYHEAEFSKQRDKYLQKNDKVNFGSFDDIKNGDSIEQILNGIDDGHLFKLDLCTPQELLTLQIYIADPQYPIANLTSLLGKMCQIYDLFYHKFIESCLHIQLIHRYIDQDVQQSSPLLYFLSVLIKNGCQNTIFIDSVYQVIQKVDNLLNEDFKQVPIHNYTILIYLLVALIPVNEIIHFLQNLCKVHLRLYLCEVIDQDLIKTHEALLQAISIVFNMDSQIVVSCKFIVHLVNHVAFDIKDEGLSETAMNLLARFLSGIDDQTYMVLYFTDSEDSFLDQRLLKIIKSNQLALNVRRQSALALSNLFASQTDLLDRFHQRGTLIEFLSSIDNQDDFYMKVQMYYGIRNLICMADYEVVQVLLSEGLINVISHGLQHGNGEQITTILEAILFLIDKEKEALAFENKLEIKNYIYSSRIDVFLENFIIISKIQKEVDICQQILVYLQNE